jgi:hypothetical protein
LGVFKERTKRKTCKKTARSSKDKKKKDTKKTSERRLIKKKCAISNRKEKKQRKQKKTIPSPPSRPEPPEKKVWSQTRVYEQQKEKMKNVIFFSTKETPAPSRPEQNACELRPACAALLVTI